MTSTGTYSPVIDPVTNVLDCSPILFRWTKNKNSLTVVGELSVTTGGAGLSEFDISLPEQSTFENEWDIAGLGYLDFDGSNAVAISASVDKARFTFNSDAELSGVKMFFSFTYVF